MMMAGKQCFIYTRNSNSFYVTLPGTDNEVKTVKYWRNNVIVKTFVIEGPR